jgi:hypothetical protein
MKFAASSDGALFVGKKQTTTAEAIEFLFVVIAVNNKTCNRLVKNATILE